MILIVDDDDAQRRMTGAMLNALDRPWREAAGGTEALELLSTEDGDGITLILLDLMMPDMSGTDLLEALKERGSAPPVLMLTAHGSVAAAVETMRAGAQDFLIKPVSAEKLEKAIRAALRLNEAKGPAARPSNRRGDSGGAGGFDRLIAESPATRRAIQHARQAARTGIPVLIQGESGVGKEVFAKAIHGESERRGGAFVPVNCGALPENLVESILFGHEKGAFTGAVARRAGKFEEANGGVLFLDEVGELPLDAQVKLLRAIQEGEIDPVGGSRTVRTDIRLVSATNRDLWADVRAGRFREDLYYRISVFPLTLPPLRSRRADIAPLAELFAKRIAEREDKRLDGLTTDALALLSGHDWPGNVRQLENAIYRAIVLAGGRRLDESDFSFLVHSASEAAPARSPAADDEAPPRGGNPFFDASGHIRTLAEIEAEAVDQAMARYSGAMSEAARRLGIGRSTLYRKTKGEEGGEHAE